MKVFDSLVTLSFFLFTHLNLKGQQWPLKEWLVATPQSQSMNADSLKAFDNAIASGKYGYVDGWSLQDKESWFTKKIMNMITIKHTVITLR